MVLEDLLFKLDALESRWGELTAFCDTLTPTLVHGDLVSKNLRIMRRGKRTGLAIFDWETAGVGVQAADLTQLLGAQRAELALRQKSKRFYRFSANPCLDTYRSELGASATDPGADTVEQAAAVGSLFRCLASIDWSCLQSTTDWCPTDDLRVYSGWLGEAMQLAGWSSSSTPAKIAG